MIKNKKVKAVNPSSLKLEEGVIIQDLQSRKMYKVKFDSGGEYYLDKNRVRFI